MSVIFGNFKETRPSRPVSGTGFCPCVYGVFSTSLFGAIPSTEMVAAIISNKRDALCTLISFLAVHTPAPPPSRHNGQRQRYIPADRRHTGGNIHFSASPLLEFFQVLTQAVGVVFRHHRRFAVWSAFGNVVIFLYAVQRAVFRLVLFVCTSCKQLSRSGEALNKERFQPPNWFLLSTSRLCSAISAGSLSRRSPYGGLLNTVPYGLF